MEADESSSSISESWSVKDSEEDESVKAGVGGGDGCCCAWDTIGIILGAARGGSGVEAVNG